MKKKVSFFTILAILGILCACASGGKKTNSWSLDSAILQATKEINDALSAGTKVALLNFNSDSDVFSDYVLEEMSIAFVKGKKLVVVDRKEIDLIRKEMNFQMSGEVSDESAQKIGVMLGAQSIISGSLVNMGENYRFRTKAINVNSAVIEAQSSISVNSDPQIKYLLSQGKKTSAPQVAQGTSPTQAQPSAPAAPTAPVAPVVPEVKAYKIGDIGPAGGIIFYDKGNNSGGWRYLEAAPAKVEFQAPWSVKMNILNMVKETRSDIGSGKQNTQLIIDLLKRFGGEWNSAAIKISELNVNGFTDWFLPSSGELDQMFGNLKRRNLGDLSDGFYWSSTEYRQGPDLGWGVTAIDFRNGKATVAEIGVFDNQLSKKLYVRPIRQVEGPSGASRSSVDNPIGTDGTRGSSTKASRGKIGLLDILYVLAGIAIFGYIGYVLINNPNPNPNITLNLNNVLPFAYDVRKP